VEQLWRPPLVPLPRGAFGERGWIWLSTGRASRSADLTAARLLPSRAVGFLRIAVACRSAFTAAARFTKQPSLSSNGPVLGLARKALTAATRSAPVIVLAWSRSLTLTGCDVLLTAAIRPCRSQSYSQSLIAASRSAPLPRGGGWVQTGAAYLSGPLTIATMPNPSAMRVATSSARSIAQVWVSCVLSENPSAPSASRLVEHRFLAVSGNIGSVSIAQATQP
jgi:hypothetical protein